MKLQSIIEHSDYLETLKDLFELQFKGAPRKWELHCLRKEFGKRDLKLSMFIPCDEDDEPLKEPDRSNFDKTNLGSENYKGYIYKYEKAQDRVLFSGFESYETSRGVRIYTASQLIYDFLNGFVLSTIEDLVELELKLTETAIKQLEL